MLSLNSKHTHMITVTVQISKEVSATFTCKVDVSRGKYKGETVAEIEISYISVLESNDLAAANEWLKNEDNEQLICDLLEEKVMSKK